MKPTLEDRLFRRELGNSVSRDSKIRGIYGTTRFVQDLDIVNELNGHNGCVNALSWSKSGRLLASGSDDRMINIYSYLPDYSNRQFELATQIDTGHSRNIFSVKFMPHSNDRTIVSAAGDAQIRVFDIERAAVSGGSRVQLSQNQANGKVFRSHSGACKRIVTEASPFYFLSCAEDGDVRQWDIRQPESAYPRSASRYRYHGLSSDRRDDAPPPLISYQDYNIDLMTISCSSSQPHYIALGGTALHCGFLHDRRMLGRDTLKERGGLPIDENELAAATKCVRKFAPHGQPKMSRSDPKSITACKISDNNPNELIVSWNGDFIYSFDIMRDDAESDKNAHGGFTNGSSSGRIKARKDRKRKRKEESTSSLNQLGANRGGSRPRAESEISESGEQGTNMSLLFQMANGQSVEIPIPGAALSESRLTTTHSERSGDETIAQQVRQVRNLLNSQRQQDNTDNPILLRNQMDQVLVKSTKLLEKIDKLMSEWTYPTTESRNQIAFQQKLREDRAKTWRFVQACGTISRVISRRPAHESPRRILELFDMIKPAPRESSMPLERHEQFGYDFVKTVLLWLDSGVGAVLREFTNDPDNPSASYRKRRPVSMDAGVDAIDFELIPYLHSLASDVAVDDLDGSLTEGYIFETEREAVATLARAMKLPFADLAGNASELDGSGRPISQDRETAVRFWSYRVCRSVLKNAAIDVTYSLVDTAFGEFMGASYTTEAEVPTDAPSDDAAGDEDENENENEENDDEMSDAMEVEEDYSSDSESDSDSDEESEHAFMLGPRTARSKMTAGKNVPCITHTSYYRGHCNVETTKDVNFFGLQDEYVVSGSDCGNLFIWDKKTTKLLNILEGDSEVVNVITGHPYEPILAASGIDSTVKIFGVDARARKNACLGKGIEEVDRSAFSSIRSFGRRERERRRRERATDEPPRVPDSAFDLPEESPPTLTSSEPAFPNRSRAVAADRDDEAEVLWYEDEAFIDLKGGLKSRKRMDQEYQIVSRNDMDRRRGARQGGFITRGMLAMLAQHMRAQAGEDGDDGEVEVDPEGCEVM